MQHQISTSIQYQNKLAHLNRRLSSFHKHLIKCKNINDNFSIKTKRIVHNIYIFRIEEALLIVKLHTQINIRLELSTEYIIN